MANKKLPPINLGEFDIIKKTPSMEQEKSFYEILTSNKNVNKLVFPDSTREYEVKNFEEEFRNLGLICDNTANCDSVRKYLHLESGMVMAVKAIVVKDKKFRDAEIERSMKYLLREIDCHQTLSKSPHVVGLYGICFHEGRALFCMEFMDVTLLDFYKVVHELGEFSEDLLGYIAVQILDALVVCKKEYNIMHRDIKPTNVLLNRRGQIKLGDFGLFREMVESQASSNVGTTSYLPPERFKNPFIDQITDRSEKIRYDIRSEVWALGITLLEIAHNQHPYASCQHALLLGKTICDPEMTPRLSEAYSEDARDFVKACLTYDVDERPTFDALKLLPFYRIHSDPDKKSLMQEILSDRN